MNLPEVNPKDIISYKYATGYFGLGWLIIPLIVILPIPLILGGFPIQGIFILLFLIWMYFHTKKPDGLTVYNELFIHKDRAYYFSRIKKVSFTENQVKFEFIHSNNSIVIDSRRFSGGSPHSAKQRIYQKKRLTDFSQKSIVRLLKQKSNAEITITNFTSLENFKQNIENKLTPKPKPNTNSTTKNRNKKRKIRNKTGNA